MNKMTRWILSILFAVSLIACPLVDNSYAKTAYQKTALTGGTATSLDGINGSSLTDGDFAYTMVSNVLYVHILNASSGATESSPDVIAPDTNAGTKRWILQQTHPASETRAGGAELATTAEAITGTDTSRIVTPAGLAAAQAVLVNPKAYSQGVAMTYAASGSTGIQVADNDNIDFGTGNFFLYWEGSLSDWTPSVITRLLYKYQDAANRFSLYVQATTGKIVYVHEKTGGTTVEKTTTLANSFVDGTKHKILAVITRETASTAGSVAIYFNGNLFETLTIAAGTPADISNTGSLYVAGSAAERFASTTISAAVGNFAPTTAEVLDMQRNGIPESWKWGSQTAVYTSDFSAGVDGWTATGGTAAGNIDGIGGVDDVFRLTANADSAHYCAKASVFSLLKYNKLILSYYIPSANSVIKQIKLYSGSIFIGSAMTTTDAWTTFTVDFKDAVNVNLTLYMANAAGAISSLQLAENDVIYFKTVKTYLSGATLAIEPEGMQPAPGQCLDSSSNNLHALQPASGSSLIRYKKDFEFRSTNVWTASSAAQYIGGINQNVLSTKHFITSIVSRATVTTDDEDIIIGDGSDTDYYVTTITPTTAPLTHTLAHQLNDGTNLKLVVTPAAEATMTLEFIVRGYLLE